LSATTSLDYGVYLYEIQRFGEVPIGYYRLH